MNSIPPPRYIIGIDAGTNTGIAVWDGEEMKFIEICTVKIHVAMDIVKRYAEAGLIHVRVEDARQVKFQTKDVQAQGAGSVKRDATIWEDFLLDLYVPFEMLRPAKALTKWPAAYFRKVTGWTASTNEHGRDAACLVFKFKSSFASRK